MEAEFDTVAGWTADVALDLGPEHHLPAACRGSGSPGALRWLLERLEVGAEDAMLDVGAGVGGPAAFAAAETGVRPVLSEPEPAACLAARRLFSLPVVRAAAQLPFATGSFDVVWCLGVVCTVPDQPQLVAELRRVLRPGGRLGLLAFVADGPLPEQPEGNHFPTAEHLAGLLADAGLATRTSASAADFAAAPPLWDQRAAEVEAELGRRHGHDRAWQTAERQSATIGRLLGSGALAGTLVVARAD
jgi:SAM-dependent methyltransferase